mmetsp:Transcript_42418/g.107822  ORF Transcript_42418/g.107822 Transcript_42418/m.107822 type:complete len:224 (-) Transcript_42418:2106-2777(-)
MAQGHHLRLRRRCHGRRSTHQSDGAFVGREHVGLKHLLGHESHIKGPSNALGHAVHCVPQLESIRTSPCLFVKILAQKDVVRRLVRIEHADLRVVLGILQDGAQHLVARREACTTGDQNDPLALPRLVVPSEGSQTFVNEFTDRALDVDAVADLHGVQVLRHLAPIGKTWVHARSIDLHEQVDVAHGTVIRHGRVRPHDQFAVDPRLQQHVHARREPQPRGRS